MAAHPHPNYREVSAPGRVQFGIPEKCTGINLNMDIGTPALLLGINNDYDCPGIRDVLSEFLTAKQAVNTDDLGKNVKEKLESKTKDVCEGLRKLILKP